MENPLNGYIRGGMALALAASTATAASAQQVKNYGEVAGWEIEVSEAMGPGCLIMKNGGGLQVQLGVQARGGKTTGYMAAFTRARVGVKEGEVVPVLFDVGGRRYSGQAFGERKKGFEGAWVPFDNPEFVYEVAKQETMTISVGGSLR